MSRDPSERTLDVICLGRAAVDLYGQQVGGRLEDMVGFRKYLGGSSANLAAGLAREFMAIGVRALECQGQGAGWAVAGGLAATLPARVEWWPAEPVIGQVVVPAMLVTDLSHAPTACPG